jgi:hypothetical protein
MVNSNFLGLMNWMVEFMQFMHNGAIAEWPRIKRRVQNGLPDVAFNMVQGNTGMSQCLHPVL